MKILSVSDVVEPTLYPTFIPEHFPDIDLILSCGDLPPEYLAFLMHRLNAPLYYVRGNHDIRYAVRPPQGCGDMDNRLIRFRGLRILGLEGSRWYNGSPVQYTEWEMRKKIEKLRLKLWWSKGVDMIITHAPPRFIHDAEDLCHRGFRSFLTLIKRYRPGYFIHGHIHRRFDEPGDRITVFDQTRVINTCGYHILEIDDDEISAKTQGRPDKGQP